MAHERERDEILVALLRGIDVEVWLDDAGQPNASRSDGGRGARIVADDIFDLRRAGLVTWSGPTTSLQTPQSVALTDEGRARAERLRAAPGAH
jgi:hypothetical protein